MKLPLFVALALLIQQPLLAQPADLPVPAAKTGEYPPGIAVRQTRSGPVYANARGRTLYGMDMRTVLRWSPDASQFCKDRCAEWEPMLAGADAKPNIAFPRGFGGPPAPRVAGAPPRPPGPPALPPGFVTPQSAPDWTIIAGPLGPQWVYKGWHMAYVRKGEPAGSTAHDGADEQTWNTLKYVPPVPQIVAPASVTTLFTGGAYALADRGGRLLFTGKCSLPCADWSPLTAPMAGRGLGEWSVSLASDNPQWAWRGQPVFVSPEADPLSVPRNGKVLRP
jgi:predicted lipoprotein with Yx(FWY)xxD motif